MKTAHANLSRRAFLLAATAGTAAAAAALVAARNESRSRSSKGQGGDTAPGYRLTAHVHNYYRTAKI